MSYWLRGFRTSGLRSFGDQPVRVEAESTSLNPKPYTLNRGFPEQLSD